MTRLAARRASSRWTRWPKGDAVYSRTFRQAARDRQGAERRDAATFEVDDYDEFKAKLEDPGGFLLAHWCGDGACETRVQEETKATIRCLAFDQPEEKGACMICGGASNKRAHIAKAY